MYWYIPNPQYTYEYDISCFSDHGHLNYMYKNISSNKLPYHLINFIFDKMQKYTEQYLTKHGKYTINNYRMKKGYNNTYTYKYIYQGDIYIVNMTYDL